MAGGRRVEDSADSASGIYSIGAVARMLGVAPQTLRAWEDRYQQIVPARSEGGQRLFSRDQVDQLSFIRDQIDQGLQPADAHRLLAQQLGAGDATSARDEPRRGTAGRSREATITVLIAERDQWAAEFAEYFLRTEGYDVQVVLDPAVADEMLRDEPPSVLVVELLIAGGAGLALCQTAHDIGSVPVLAISSVDLQDQALAAGAEAFLVKPLDPLRFVSAVRDLAGTSAYLRHGKGRT